MITTANIKEWIDHPDLLDRSSLYQIRTAMERYPYFPSLRLLFLKNLYLLHDETFGTELRKSAVFVPDRGVLFNLIEGELYETPSVTPPVSTPVDVAQNEPGLDRTLSLIDHYLQDTPKEPKPEQKPATPINYATDYVAYLMQLEEENPTMEPEVPKSHSDELIDGFISENRGEFKIVPDSPDEEMPEPIGPDMSASVDDEGCFTETLAKIYIKQKRYDKALEIIRKLYLKNPKKNTYFADQIRFLEKLIINAKPK